MLYYYFYLYPYIIKDIKMSIYMIYVNTLIYLKSTTSTHSDIIYKYEGSSNDDGDKGANVKDDSDKGDSGKGDSNQAEPEKEEESLEIEEEIADIEKLMKLSNDALILDEKLPKKSIIHT